MLDNYNACNVCKLDHDYQYDEAVQAHRKIMLQEARERHSRFSFVRWFRSFLELQPAKPSEYYMYAFMLTALALLLTLTLTSR